MRWWLSAVLRHSARIFDDRVMEARRPRLTRDETQTLRVGGTLRSWSQVRAGQIDRDGRWTITLASAITWPPAARLSFTENLYFRLRFGGRIHFVWLREIRMVRVGMARSPAYY